MRPDQDTRQVFEVKNQISRAQFRWNSGTAGTNSKKAGEEEKFAAVITPTTGIAARIRSAWKSVELLTGRVAAVTGSASGVAVSTQPQVVLATQQAQAGWDAPAAVVTLGAATMICSQIMARPRMIAAVFFTALIYHLP